LIIKYIIFLYLLNIVGPITSSLLTVILRELFYLPTDPSGKLNKKKYNIENIYKILFCFWNLFIKN